MKRTTATLMLLLLIAAGCGRYGAPVRAEEYRDAQRERDKAKAEEAEKSDQERNAPMPPSP